jgi:hypothetical protein
MWDTIAPFPLKTWTRIKNRRTEDRVPKPILHSKGGTFMTDEEIQRLRRWNDELAASLTVECRTAEDSRSDTLEAFCTQLSRYAPNVGIRWEKAEEEGDTLPSLRLGQGWVFHAAPHGTELAPFLDLLGMVSRGEPSMAEPLKEALAGIPWPGQLKIYVTSRCPFCPEALRKVGPLPLVNSLIALDVIDAELFPELAQEDQIQATPTVILDDRFRWTGDLSLENLADALVHRDPAELGPGNLKNMLKEGEAGRLAEMMLEKGQVFPAFLQLIPHPEWSVRLGAMVTVEEMGEGDPALVGEILEHFRERLGELEKPVLGDILYLYGEYGDPSWAPFLEGFLETVEDRELREAGEEALERLRSRHT